MEMTRYHNFSVVSKHPRQVRIVREGAAIDQAAEVVRSLIGEGAD